MPRTRGLVFISHDSRDAEIAEAFANLIHDVSAGTLKSFRSSDRKGTTGLEFGTEWYTSIMSKLGDATDVVALLTQRSLDRPWILYEAGVAKGKLNTTVFGIAIGVPLEKVSAGPFGQFQNSSDDEDSLTELLLQLAARNPELAPREESVRLHVRAFRDKLPRLVKSSLATNPPGLPPDDRSVAKLFEEVKVMVRELPDKILSLSQPASNRVPRRARRLHPALFEEFLRQPAIRESTESQAAAWMMVISVLRDDYPWLYEIGLDLYRALRAGKAEDVAEAKKSFQMALSMISRVRVSREFFAPDDEEAILWIRNLPELIEPLWSRLGVPIERVRSKKGDPRS